MQSADHRQEVLLQLLGRDGLWTSFSFGGPLLSSSGRDIGPPAGNGPTELPRARWWLRPVGGRRRDRRHGRARLGAGRALRDATLQWRLSVSSRPLPPSSSLAPPARRLASLSGRRRPGPAWVAGKGNAVTSWFRPRRLPGRRRHGDVTRHQTDAHWTFLSSRI